MRTLIVGEGKSGTTALLRSIADAFPDANESFEPSHLDELTSGPLVVKKLLAAWKPSEAAALDSFDRIVYLVRDPRDRLISHLLYDAYNRGASLSQEQTDRWLGSLERKTNDPAAVPLVRMMDTWWKMTDADLLQGYIRTLWRMSAFWREHGDRTFLFRYEDLISAQFDDLSDYLGVPLQPPTVSGAETRVMRSGTDGDWRHWFTKVDVNVFRSSTTKWLRRHGYAHRDWDLAKQPTIDPATSTEYVRRLLNSVRDGRAV